MNRRDFIQRTALLLGATGVLSPGSLLRAAEMKRVASAADYIQSKATIFNEEQRAIVAAMADIVIPATDTPGAVAAKVPHFIELMVQEWMNEQEKAIFWSGLKDINDRALQENEDGFSSLSSEQQLIIMEKLEDEASTSSWYQRGNVHRGFISDAPFICQVKELTIWGFFTSETGTREVLQYNPMPMQFDGHYPKDKVRATWSPQTFYN